MIYIRLEDKYQGHELVSGIWYTISRILFIHLIGIDLVYTHVGPVAIPLLGPLTRVLINMSDQRRSPTSPSTNSGTKCKMSALEGDKDFSPYNPRGKLFGYNWNPES